MISRGKLAKGNIKCIRGSTQLSLPLQVSVGSSRRPRVDSNPTTYRFEAMPFVEWFKVTYMSP
ncbi:hypothetical protein E2C01_006256 [Portunus trituberculatus]|uniref:Uncharacterized protein n=1 Tax=Portunus trituberculatus TaxID=210409 RepID=A0A5B7CVT7_PORTR|nr:hypothetical protein [Portunus trituberculatus]